MGILKNSTAYEIKKYLDKDLEFNYNSRGACFLSSICVVGYDYEGQQFDTIDEAMEAKVFDGKSLVDIWGAVQMYEIFLVLI